MTAHAGDWSLAIDVGTHRIAAASAGTADDGARPTPAVVPLGTGGGTFLPSLVCLDDNGRMLLGEAATEAAARRPERAERAAKRALVEQERVLLGSTAVVTADLVTALLSQVLEQARVRHGGTAPGRTVLTHPAHWTPTQLARLGAAAGAAGITKPEFLPEPVAAAHHHAAGPGLPDSARPGDLRVGAHLAVYDLGSTLKTAVLAWDGARFTVVRTGGDPHLGGDDLDDCLRELLAERVLDRDPGLWQDLWEAVSPEAAQQRAELHRSLVAAREALSSSAGVDVPVPGYPEPFLVRGHEFRAAAEPVLERSFDVLAETLQKSGHTPGDLHAVIVAGGAGRTPRVSELIAERTGLLPLLAPDPSATVVLGALARPPAVAAGPGATRTPAGPVPGAAARSKSPSTFNPDDPFFEL
ncbi:MULTISPECIES: Hsp70 family protein [unclassified Streptomyces]|uniref:Hsp70 family protein n=1 Tax=unclassified Streptomyces TaxID=2593676 RepID=UPI00380778CC